MTAAHTFEIGLFTFGEITADPVTGQPINPAVRLREFIELAKIADTAGLDVFGVGEHHRPDFAIASPAVVLAAIAQATEHIRLTSTVTVLSTADPVKVFEDFTAVDLISGPGARGQLLPRDAFDAWAGPRGALFAGSPQEVIDKILWEHELLGHDRFLAQIGLGGLPFAATARSIELLATEVLPTIRREAAPRPAVSVS